MTGILSPFGPAGIARTIAPGIFCRANLAASQFARPRGRANWLAAKFARQKMPGAIVRAIPAGPNGDKIPVISNASCRANYGTQIAKRSWATDLGDRPAGRQ